jgi:hypothetical protein
MASWVYWTKRQETGRKRGKSAEKNGTSGTGRGETESRGEREREKMGTLYHTTVHYTTQERETRTPHTHTLHTTGGGMLNVFFLVVLYEM